MRPRGGVVAFPYLRRVTDVEAFCQLLMERSGVLLVPGTCFGWAGHVRLGFGGPRAELEAGLAAVSATLEASGQGSEPRRARAAQT